MSDRITLRAPRKSGWGNMRLTEEGQEGQLVSVAFDMAAFKVRVDYFKGPRYEEHRSYEEGFSRYHCFEGIEEAPRGRFDPELLRFESTSGGGKEIGVRVGQEFYDLLPFAVVRDAVCSYSVRPGITGVPTSTGQLLALFILKELPGVPESAVDSEAVPAPVRDREVVKAVARVEALVPEPIPKHPPVGRKLRLNYIPEEMFDMGSFDGLCLGHIETYRIVRTFAKQAGGDSEWYYNQVGGSQLRGLLKRRKIDMLVRRKDERRREIEKMSTGITVVQEYVVGLMKRGLFERVVKGRPSSKKYGPGYVSKYQVAMSEWQRFRMLIERKEKGRKKKS